MGLEGDRSLGWRCTIQLQGWSRTRNITREARVVMGYHSFKPIRGSVAAKVVVEERAERALIILNNLSHSQDSSSGKFIMRCQLEEGLNPQKSGGFPNPFPSRAEGGSREVEGECVGRVGVEHAIGRAVLGCEVFEVGVRMVFATEQAGMEGVQVCEKVPENIGGNGKEVTGNGEGYGGGYNFYGVELSEVVEKDKGVGHGSQARSPFCGCESLKASVLQTERKSVRCPVHLVFHHGLDSEFEAFNSVADDNDHCHFLFPCEREEDEGALQ
nr:hypothetical protein CFP56_46480 [Quercus suber]